ncbi:hypothetical protein SCG7086_AV_00060 [Chlamydiales bacterium SCGC AG-110-P3]|nr:hypothetical protein SCG7086_AV_00060 [Chlamydiales bacterium SCGC AG-110-P3]
MDSSAPVPGKSYDFEFSIEEDKEDIQDLPKDTSIHLEEVGADNLEFLLEEVDKTADLGFISPDLDLKRVMAGLLAHDPTSTDSSPAEKAGLNREEIDTLFTQVPGFTSQHGSSDARIEKPTIELLGEVEQGTHDYGDGLASCAMTVKVTLKKGDSTITFTTKVNTGTWDTTTGKPYSDTGHASEEVSNAHDELKKVDDELHGLIQDLKHSQSKWANLPLKKPDNPDDIKTAIQAARTKQAGLTKKLAKLQAEDVHHHPVVRATIEAYCNTCIGEVSGKNTTELGEVALKESGVFFLDLKNGLIKTLELDNKGKYQVIDSRQLSPALQKIKTTAEGQIKELSNTFAQNPSARLSLSPREAQKMSIHDLLEKLGGGKDEALAYAENVAEAMITTTHEIEKLHAEILGVSDKVDTKELKKQILKHEEECRTHSRDETTSLPEIDPKLFAMLEQLHQLSTDLQAGKKTLDKLETRTHKIISTSPDISPTAQLSEGGRHEGFVQTADRELNYLKKGTSAHFSFKDLKAAHDVYESHKAQNPNLFNAYPRHGKTVGS